MKDIAELGEILERPEGYFYLNPSEAGIYCDAVV